MSDEQNGSYKAFDDLLDPKGPVMLVGQQFLKIAAISNDDIVFPPSYANPSEKKDDPPVYNIDDIDPHGPIKNVCVLDSIPSQANRMEPLFAEPPHDSLVPQYFVKFSDERPPTSILEIGHRIADAAFRGTDLRETIVAAFKAYAKGDAALIAKIAPTSLVFGAWDSRGTGVKVPRLVNSIIRAFNVTKLKRSAQYFPPIEYEREGLIPGGLEGKPADHGLAAVPSTHEIGGVQIQGDIRRDYSLNLELLREIRAPLSDEKKKAIRQKHQADNPNQPSDQQETAMTTAVSNAQREADLKIQRYILGLALLAFTATQKSTLRQGCQLLPKGDPIWKRFRANGEENPWTPPSNIAKFAQAAANKFGVIQPPNQSLVFSKERLKASIEADAKKKASKKAETDLPIDTINKLIDGLKVSADGKKINKPGLEKLNHHLDTISEGPAKALAESIKEVIGGTDAPQVKIDRIKQLVADAKTSTTSDSEAASPIDEDSQEEGE
jgi:CRISPR-associated protein Csb1